MRKLAITVLSLTLAISGCSGTTSSNPAEKPQEGGSTPGECADSMIGEPAKFRLTAVSATGSDADKNIHGHINYQIDLVRHTNYKNLGDSFVPLRSLVLHGVQANVATHHSEEFEFSTSELKADLEAWCNHGQGNAVGFLPNGMFWGFRFELTSLGVLKNNNINFEFVALKALREMSVLDIHHLKIRKTTGSEDQPSISQVDLKLTRIE